MDMECVIYMGEVDIERQKPNVERMRILGADVRPATSGSKTLKVATNTGSGLKGNKLIHLLRKFYPIPKTSLL